MTQNHILQVNYGYCSKTLVNFIRAMSGLRSPLLYYIFAKKKQNGQNQSRQTVFHRSWMIHNRRITLSAWPSHESQCNPPLSSRKNAGSPPIKPVFTILTLNFQSRHLRLSLKISNRSLSCTVNHRNQPYSITYVFHYHSPSACEAALTCCNSSQMSVSQSDCHRFRGHRGSQRGVTFARGGQK